MLFNPYHTLRRRTPDVGPKCIGIEVELEGLNAEEQASLRHERLLEAPSLRNACRAGWTVTTDGSLRAGGVEFISGPDTLENHLPRVELLYMAITEGLVRPSVRTGIHVHVNMQHASNLDMLAFMRAYVVLEPLLFQYVGVERRHNIYCVPLYWAENERRLWRSLARELQAPGSPGTWIVLWRAFCKYSALNLESFARFGTFEFRHAPTFWQY
jgi:hypothetical protein